MEKALKGLLLLLFLIDSTAYYEEQKPGLG
ncbi:hypothetical protein PA905_06410 [Planktothrix agardhii CCAP 1459/11A]|jgi:hypothetical protein|uniref:Uncharacterized protein n=2 Tax=Planktothrix agardhii TaxID=1160 RepID=A0A4P5ZDD5_PLAAG|nr:hypothetical protein PCC7805_00934 [Planktothrix agardhii]CAD5930463.1 hypothetical protein PCC7821_01245 [Planktothrix rubescens NIVA-CYA 18]CAD5936354.1 hypothetical protein NO108_02004 [Planktothrix rubescens]BBD55257.1 hypothetical protein NIES204_25590 [Planktothrix agardhii NIES-204]GDZ92944.1 hypothetical protein PA905_06410 [Planktothrix agardhii CCAP 1459/11A]